MKTPSPPDLYRQLLDNSSDSIFCFAPDFIYLYANQAFAKGIGKNLEEIVGRTVWDVFPKDEADKRASIVKRVFDLGVASTHEILVRGRDGDRYYLTTVTPIFGDQGRVRSVLANSKDITERKKFEEELRHSQAMLKRTESFAHIGSWEWDVATDNVTWSDELFRIFLRSPADRAPSFAEHAKLYYPEDMQRLKAAVEIAVSHGTPYELELRAIRKDGETRVCLARGHAEMGPNGTAAILFGSLQDITERKQAEENIRTSEGRLTRAELASKSGNWELHLDSKTIVASVGAAAIYGLTMNSFNLIAIQRMPLPEFRPMLDAALTALIEDDAPYDVEFKIRSMDNGEIKDIRSRAIVDRERRVLFGIIQDITEKKRTEIELERHRLHLEELVAARTAELEQSRDAAEAGNRAKTIFLANMSHELRTPMNGVMGMIDIVLRRATDPKQIDWLNKGKSAAQRMVNVVSDIIDFSKAEAERLPLEEKNFSLNQLIDDAIAMQGVAAQAKGLNLIREIHTDLPDQLSGDAFHLRQILLNLLGNACKFSDQGTITVRVSAVEQDGDSVLARIEVEDQGIGISPEQQAMLFQAFTQADGSITRKYGGSGLGLIISKRLANLMGGDAGMVSQEGHGSTFWATARLKPAKASEDVT